MKADAIIAESELNLLISAAPAPAVVKEKKKKKEQKRSAIWAQIHMKTHNTIYSIFSGEMVTLYNDLVLLRKYKTFSNQDNKNRRNICRKWEINRFLITKT